MKKLILSEGKDDTYFVHESVKRYDSGIDTDVVDIEDKTIAEQKPLESEEIREFIPRFNPYAVLAKSEGGQNSLKKIFCSLVADLARRELDFFLVIDLDGGDLEEYIDDIRLRIDDVHAGNDVILNRINQIETSDVIIIVEYEVIFNQQSIDRFCVIAFTNSLEDVAGITGSDDWETRQDKIDDVIDNPELFDPLISTLFS